VPVRTLPREPNLERLRNLAKTVQRLVREGDEGAVELAREFHPRIATRPGGTAHEDAVALGRFTRADAQLTLARSYGFPSWPKLRAHVEAVNRLTRNPHRQPAADPAGDDTDLVGDFLRLACLTYGGDDPTRSRQARALLADNPGLASATIHTAAAVGDVAAARRLLEGDPRLARLEGGPHQWEPLLYLAYSRVDSDEPGHSPVEVARLLLDAGADPDAGYLWESVYPFTALTGAFGDGETGRNTPPHRSALDLARLLLDAGADPNDSQTLYNRQWRDDDAHLELLLDHGLGRGTVTTWATRLGVAEPTPQQLVEEELRRAAAAGRIERVRLLVDRIDDLDGIGTDHPVHGGRTAHELAVLHGNTEIAALLERAGARPRRLDPVDELRAAAMAADRAAVDRLLAADPGLANRLAEEQPDLIASAVEVRRLAAVRLLVVLGLDLNPGDRPTPLHHAAFAGQLTLVRELIALGADPDIADPTHGSTPHGWAVFNQQHEVAAYLATRE
jgi:ankyrin repeat protein